MCSQATRSQLVAQMKELEVDRSKEDFKSKFDEPSEGKQKVKGAFPLSDAWLLLEGKGKGWGKTTIKVREELEEAAELAGASWIVRFRRIIMPLSSSGVLSGMMVSFVGVMRELSLIVLLITPSTRVLMTVGFGYAEEGLTQLSNALVLIVAVLTIIGELILMWIGKGKMARLREKQS